MRRVTRGKGTAPSALTALSSGKTELERAREHYGDPYDPKTGTFEFKVYRAAEVKTRLEDLFHGKCAYCETIYASTAPVDVEHFRPKGAVEHEDRHLGYWWLAMSWENLLPSCIDCNRRRKQVTPIGEASLQALDENARAFTTSKVIQSGKKDAFPIAGTRAFTEQSDIAAEQPLLLNPCEDDPDEHLAFYHGAASPIALVVPNGLENTDGVVAPSVRGATSIQVYGLNRLGLVQERTRVLRQLGFFETLIIELGRVAEDLEAGATGTVVPSAVGKLRSMQDEVLAQLKAMAAPRAPYSAMVKAWLQGFAARVAAA